MSTENGTTTPFIPRQRRPVEDTAIEIFPMSMDKGDASSSPVFTDFRAIPLPADAPEEELTVDEVEDENDPKDSSAQEPAASSESSPSEESPATPSTETPEPPVVEEPPAPPVVEESPAPQVAPAPVPPAAKVSTPPRVRAPGKPRS